MSDALVGIRNENVITAMREKYASLTGDARKLTMFCISNLHYGMHVEGYDEENIPISLELTGIPAVRIWASRFPVVSKLKALKQHCKFVLPGLINSIELWTDKSALENREDLRSKISKPSKVRTSTTNRMILINHRSPTTTSQAS